MFFIDFREKGKGQERKRGEIERERHTHRLMKDRNMNQLPPVHTLTND